MKRNQKNRKGKRRINKDYRKWGSWRKSTKRQEVVFKKLESQRWIRVRYLNKSMYLYLMLRQFQMFKKRQPIPIIDMLPLKKHQKRLWSSRTNRRNMNIFLKMQHLEEGDRTTKNWSQVAENKWESAIKRSRRKRLHRCWMQ